ncbi:MAG: hypothetical protein ACWGN2_09605 [Anaerolineales bacterium]
MSTNARSKTELGLRISAFLLGIVVLIWLSVEDKNTLWVVIVSGVICVWAGIWVLVRPVEGVKRIISRHSLIGIAAGLAIAPLAILLMALKSGIHGHGTPEFSIPQMQAVLSRTPYFALSGLLIGLGTGLWRSVREDPEMKAG